MMTWPRLLRRVSWACGARAIVRSGRGAASRWPGSNLALARWFVVVPVLLVATVLTAQTTYVPHRVFDARKNGFSDFEAMLADMVRADVVFVGEQHDHADTHRLQLAMLEGLARRQREVIVALEMFARDVQEPLDHFLMGHLTEADFLAAARPWPRYASDYKPLVDFASRHHWPVVAANAPHALADQVARMGLEVLKTKTEAEKTWFARDVRCPTNDPYFKRFQAAVENDHPVSGAVTDGGASNVARVYLAQCLRDETMGESIAQVLTAGAGSGKRPLVISFNGASHSDFGDGLVNRVRRRLPDKRLLVLSVQPADSLDSIAPDADERKRADYLVSVLAETP